MCLVVAPMKLKLKQCQSTVITPGFRELKKTTTGDSLWSCFYLGSAVCSFDDDTASVLMSD